MKKKLYEGLSNSGKTKEIKKRVNELIKENKSMIVLDTKKEYENLFKNTDYKIIKFDMNDLENSIEYNPLYDACIFYKNGNIDKSIEIIMLFANLLYDNKEALDPFWDNSAKNMFVGICLFILENKRNLSLKEIIKVGVNELDVLTKYINEQDVLSTINIISSNIINAPTETKGGIISVLMQKLGLFAHRPALLEKICLNKTINIEDKKQVIIIRNFSQKNNYNTIIEIMLINLINKMIESENEFSVILDNYDSMVNYDKFTELFKNYLSDNIECIVGVRDNSIVKPLDDFTVIYRDDNKIETI